MLLLLLLCNEQHQRVPGSQRPEVSHRHTQGKVLCLGCLTCVGMGAVDGGEGMECLLPYTHTDVQYVHLHSHSVT